MSFRKVTLAASYGLDEDGKKLEPGDLMGAWLGCWYSRERSLDLALLGGSGIEERKKQFSPAAFKLLSDSPLRICQKL